MQTTETFNAESDRPAAGAGAGRWVMGALRPSRAHRGGLPVLRAVRSYF